VQGGDLDTASDGGGGVSAEVVAQQLFQVGLVEHVGLGVAVPALVGVAVELGQHPHVPVHQAEPEAGTGDGGDRVAEAQSSKGAVDLVVEVDGARLWIDRLPALQHEALDAVLGEECRGGQSRRPRADDDYGNVHDVAPPRTMR
jgi:hypothetical protein